jgi:hypothetical protein
LEVKKDIVFTYLRSQGKPPVKFMPSYNFVSWKELLDIIDNDIINFDRKYELFITEVLPNKSYITNKVHSSWQRGVAY